MMNPQDPLRADLASEFGFTPRELEVIPHFTLLEKIAAHDLGISVSALKYHKLQTQARMGVANQKEVIAILAGRGVQFKISTLQIAA